MPRRSRTLMATGLAFGAVLFGAAAVGPSSADPVAGRPTAAPVAAAMVTAGRGEPRLPVAGSLSELITSLDERVAAVPDDHVSWATLGLALVQHAHGTVDPSLYPRAEVALARSLEIDDRDNFLAHAGLSALASARHDFTTAKHHAELGLAMNPFSALLHGALADAQLQLGEYDDAFATVQRMVELSPDTASLSRASYTWELRGDLTRARTLMQRALDDAPTAADRTFALVHLAGLTFDAGDPATALDLANDALAATPGDVAALAAKARALAAVGQTETAVESWARVVERAPEPGYVVEYARLLESLGRIDDAEQQWTVFDATQALFAANGVLPDASAIAADAQRGRLDRALAAAEQAVERHPFLDTYDAYAWVLHLSGRHDEAQRAIDLALQLGTRNARWHFHAGMIALERDDLARAERELTTALSINPAFDPLDAETARTALDSLEALEENS